MRAVTDFARENHAAGAEAYPRWMLKEQQLRRQLKQLVNAPSIEDIALVKNTSEAISFVAAGLEWQSGDRIITAKGEFPSNWIPWDARKVRGVEVIAVDILNAEDPEAALLAAVDDRTRVLAISSVQFASGFRLHLERIGQALKPTKTLFLVDAIQSLGILPINVQENAIDLLMADGHKWLLAPEGLGVFYVSALAREMIAPTQFGWHMVEHLGHFDTIHWQPAQSGASLRMWQLQHARDTCPLGQSLLPSRNRHQSDQRKGTVSSGLPQPNHPSLTKARASLLRRPSKRLWNRVVSPPRVRP